MMADIEDLIRSKSALQAERESRQGGESAYSPELGPNVPRPDDPRAGRPYPKKSLPRQAIEALGEGSADLGAFAGGIKGFQAGAKMGGGHPLAKLGFSILGGGVGAVAGFSGGTGIGEGLHAIDPKTFGPPKRREEFFKGAIRAGLEDMAGSGAGEALSTALRGVPIAARWMMGVGKEGTDYARETSKQFGIDLNPMDVSGSKAMEFLHRGVGQLPFVGAGFRKSFYEKGTQVRTAMNDLIYSVAPVENLAELGYQVNKLADARYKWVSDAIGKNYEDAAKYARENKVTVPGTELQRVARQTLGMLQRFKGTQYVTRGKRESKAVKFFYDELGKSSEGIPYERYQGLLGSVEKLASREKDPKIKAILLTALTDMKGQVNNLSDEHAKFLFQHADAYMTSILKPFESATSKKFDRVARNRFNKKALTKAGTREYDEIVDIAVGNSPQAVRNLKNLIQDPDTMNKIAASHLDRLFNAAIERGGTKVTSGSKLFKPEVASPGGFDADYIIKEMGLNDKNGLKYGAWKELLRGTPARIEKVEKLVNASAEALKYAPRDVNAFIARRAGIGGLKSVLGIVGGGAVVGGSLGAATGITATLVLRNMINIASNPRLLNAANVALDSSAKVPARRAAMIALMKALEGAQSDNAEAQNLQPQPQ